MYTYAYICNIVYLYIYISIFTCIFRNTWGGIAAAPNEVFPVYIYLYMIYFANLCIASRIEERRRGIAAVAGTRIILMKTRMMKTTSMRKKAKKNK